MKKIITISFLLFSIQGISQEELILGESELIKQYPDFDYPELDSVITVTDGGNTTFCDTIVVYYDKGKKNIAYRSQSFGDSCSTFDYWRNGQLKKRINYKVNDGFPNWWSQELYCKNGQVINKGPSPNQPGRKLFINYYCNGNKKNQFFHVGMGVDGKMTWWYENGAIQFEFFYDNNVPTGLWKYYDDSGKLIKTEQYENGELIETKNH